MYLSLTLYCIPYYGLSLSLSLSLSLIYIYIYIYIISNIHLWWNPRSVVAHILDCDIVMSEFELQSRYFVHFWTNTLGKRMNLLISSSYELNSTTTVRRG